MYVTPQRFITMGLGVDLTGIDDMALRSALWRASAQVDAYCNVPMLPQRFDFRGGTMTREIHEWKTDAYERPAPYRFWPRAKPVKSVSEFRIYSTPQIYTGIDVDNIFINNSGGWLEISSLQLTEFGIFGAGVVNSLFGMFYPEASCTYDYGWSFVVSGEYLEPTDAALYRAQNQWWDSTVVPEIRINNVVQTTGFTVDYDEGTVIFTSPLAAEDIVTASYTHKMPWEIGMATGMIAADDLGDAAMRGRGMTGLDSLTVGEISLRRTAPMGRRGGTIVSEALSLDAQELLNGFQFLSVR